MPPGFLTAYLREVTRSLPNWHEDNYDFYRFGSQPEKLVDRSWKSFIRKYLRQRGWVPEWEATRCVTAAVQLIETNLERLLSLYDRLADDESREILVKVLAFRALGYRKVKLPLNTPAYWDALEWMARLASQHDFIQSNFLNWRLYLMNLNSIRIPIQLYTTPLAAHTQFFLEQYRCRGDRIDIAVEAGDYVIDAGACWGDTALYFAYRSRPDGKVFCFEFNPENLDILRRNLALNPDLSSRIQIIERAVWDKSDMGLAIEGEGPATSIRVEEARTSNAGPLTLTIDDLVQRESLPRVDFIKMDIEGAELAALRGATHTIQRCRPKLAISVYHRLSDIIEVPAFLDSLNCGYRYFLRHYTIHAEETILFAEASC